VIDHLCRNTLCVRPDHLEAVTYSENSLRGVNIGRPKGSFKTHCIRGHELSGENLRIVSTSGQRQCKTCTREHARARRRQSH
jgi:hypothetical protein